MFVDSDSIVRQPTLFDVGAPAIDADFAGIERRRLDDASWVDLAPGWFGGADALLETLLAEVPWRRRRVRMYDRVVDEPRLTAWWGADDPLPHPSLRSAWTALERRYRRTFISMGANYYRNGDDSVAWHADRNRRRVVDPIIAIVVLGERRSFRLRPAEAGPAPLTLRAGHGDLLVMGGACQHRWQHCVPKTRRPVGPRVSLTFRHVHDDNYDRPPR